MNTAIPDGYRMNGDGHLVPISAIRPQQILEDELVEKIFGYARKLSAEVSRFWQHTADDVDAFQALLNQEYGVKRRGSKGNFTLTNFACTRKVQVQVQDRLRFGPELQTAKTIIDECLESWIKEGANPNLAIVVNEAFRVSKEGQISVASILGLKSYKIEDERWAEAMKAIDDSIRKDGSKRLFRIYRRESPEAPWQPVPIDLAALAPREDKPQAA